MRNFQLFGGAVFATVMFLLSDILLTRIEGYPSYISRTRLCSGAFWIAFFILYCISLPAQAQELSLDYQQGFCDGAKGAYDASMRNRDHQRHMAATTTGSIIFETHDQAIARIYGPQSKDSCKKGSTIVDNAVCVMLDSIDLYVVLPPWRGGQIVTPKGTVDCGGELK